MRFFVTSKTGEMEKTKDKESRRMKNDPVGIFPVIAIVTKYVSQYGVAVPNNRGGHYPL